MAHTTSPSVHPTFGFGLLGRGFAMIGNALIAVAEANVRVRQATALHALSDAELAERGLKREDIACKVFADCYWV